MKIPKDCKMELCASRDAARSQSIHNIHVERLEDGTGRAVATNGRMLVIVPVEFEEGDEPGYLTPEALKAGRKLKCGPDMSIKANGDLKLANGVCFPRPRVNDLPYPNYRQVIPTSEPTFRVAFNARMLADLAEAMGTEVVTLEFVDTLTAIRVSGHGRCGVLMPVREA